MVTFCNISQLNGYTGSGALARPRDDEAENAPPIRAWTLKYHAVLWRRVRDADRGAGAPRRWFELENPKSLPTTVRRARATRQAHARSGRGESVRPAAAVPDPAPRDAESSPADGLTDVAGRVEPPASREAATPRRHAVNLLENAYERLEQLIVTCDLRPGSFLRIQDLQTISGFSRTPVHQAVARLAADTLINVRPRHGLQIAPIDLARERMLLGLRRDLERFVIRLAAERLNASHRNQILHVARQLRERRDAMTIGEFNTYDRSIDRLVLSAAGELFLEHALRPLHTIYRRIGWIYHSRTSGTTDIGVTIDSHLSVLDAIADRQVDRAVAASDTLIDFVESIFGVIEQEIDPKFLDYSFELTAPKVPPRP